MVLGDLLAVDILFIVISLFILGLSGFWLYHVNLKHRVSLYQRLFNCVLVCNIVQSLIMLYWILISYINSFIYQATSDGALTALSIIASIQLVLLIFADIEIVRIFSVLKSGINLGYLELFRITTLVLALKDLALANDDEAVTVAISVMQSASLVVWANTLNRNISNLWILAVFGYFCAIIFLVQINIEYLQSFIQKLSLPPENDIAGLYAILAVLYDNCQNFYLIYTVYNFKESRLDTKLTKETILKFKELVGYLVLMVLGICFYAGFAVTYYSYYNYASMISICFHSLGMVHCLIKLKELSLTPKIEPSEPKVQLKKLVDLKDSQSTCSQADYIQNHPTEIVLSKN
ncbi:hypothetical protein HDV06_006663 [Boothiomyces sp. JEL0866]|nr:hypothetical protein HDV06_006663 [Boothiomyces sp. JEL0866]